jgi:glycosyltransferase involved in cell wall biosynthesis
MRNPLVTAVVATYNEEKYIGKCLQDLLTQTKIDGDVEIFVVDGGSRDHTLEVVRSFPEFGRKIRLLPNPKQLQTFAWNIGLRAATGKYITLISAHTEYSEDYFETCIKALERTGAANVGGVQVPVGKGNLGKVIAWSMQSPFAIGNARFRYAPNEEFVNDVFTTFLEKAVLEAIGGYDEAFPVNEDGELNYRLRKAGYTILCSPNIRVRYHPRSSLRRLAQQLFRYGFWRRKTQLRHPDYVPLRVYAPPMLVLGLLLSVALYVGTGWWAALLVPALYVAFLSAGAVNALAKLKMPLALVLAPAVLFTIHISYGSGWWFGFFAHRKKHILQISRAQSPAS